MTTKIFNHLIIFSLLICLSFSASAQETPLFTFGVMSDVQYASRENQGSRHYRSSLRKLREAVEVFNRENAAFVLHLGDFINNDFGSYDTLLSITSHLEMPLHLIAGNHEFGVEDQLKEKVLLHLGYRNGKGFTTFAMEDWRFILLDGTETGLMRFPAGSKRYTKAKKELDELKDAGAKNAFDWNGGMSNRQFRWLKRQLNQSERRSEQVVLACHFPLLPTDAIDLLFDARKVRSLVEKYPGVIAWFNGHTHVSRLIENNGVNYVTFRGMIEEEDNGFAIVSVYPGRLEIRGFGKEISRVLKDN